MFSKTCEYAIRAMIFIAQKSKEGSKVGFKEIAKGIGASEYFIAKILQDLSRKGIVQSLKGPTGGFYLDEGSSKCSLADIVTAIDGDKLFNGCGLGLKSCNEKKPCPLHDKFKILRDHIKEMLEDARIGEFSGALENKLSFLKRN
jgi:Rrf2 family protein